MWFEDGCHAAESTFVMDERPFGASDGEGVAWLEVSAGMAKDGGVIPPAVGVLGSAANGAGVVAT